MKKGNYGMIEIVKKFNIFGKPNEISKLKGGLINSTYLIKTEGESPDYILQKKNGNIFPDIPAMMENIVKVTNHIRKKIIAENNDADREVIRVIETQEGKPYFLDEDGNYWAMTLFIPETLTYEKADTPLLARKGGEGLGKFQLQLSDFNDTLFETIPGFHNLEFRFKQWDKALKEDKAGRVKYLSSEIEMIERRRKTMTEFWNLVKTGMLPKRVTHNDTKLSNFLFNKEGEIQCVIDLDTVMSNTLLADYGDAIRSFANTGLEDDPVIGNVGLDKPIFQAYTEGYLSQIRDALTPLEKEWLYFGPLYITYEQTLRFLMDYIDGDLYYQILYPDHNLVRTRAQNRLLSDMEKNIDFMKNVIAEY